MTDVSVLKDDELFTDIGPLELHSTGLVAHVHFNRGGITIIDNGCGGEDYGGKVKMGVWEARALRDWLNRILPEIST